MAGNCDRAASVHDRCPMGEEAVGEEEGKPGREARAIGGARRTLHRRAALGEDTHESSGDQWDSSSGGDRSSSSGGSSSRRRQRQRQGDHHGQLSSTNTRTHAQTDGRVASERSLAECVCLWLCLSLSLSLWLAVVAAGAGAAADVVEQKKRIYNRKRFTTDNHLLYQTT